MTLKRISYTEYPGEDRQWELVECEFSNINLIVGRNATGKSRFIGIINSFCNLLANRQKEMFESGKFFVEICIGGRNFSITIEFSASAVKSESLLVDGVELLRRDSDGIGKIFYSKENVYLDFKILPNALALQQKQDELQHPFVVELSKWAKGAHAYFFNTSFSNTSLMILSSLVQNLNKAETSFDNPDVLRSYGRAYEEHQELLDDRIVGDMNKLGYSISSCDLEDLRPFLSPAAFPEPVMGFTVFDREVGIKIPQVRMSQGMFRALCLVIQINIAALGTERTIILVDDIGEGLDFERSVALIDILLGHAKNANLQIFMTTNDRFVMNQVPLENWIILQRERSVVRAFTGRSHPKEFEEFKFMGLSNFDFFTSATFH